MQTRAVDTDGAAEGCRVTQRPQAAASVHALDGGAEEEWRGAMHFAILSSVEDGELLHYTRSPSLADHLCKLVPHPW